MNTSASTQSTAMTKVKAGILYTNSNPLSGWQWKYGLRNKDLPVGIWNVVPYSFMIDRVFNISRAIRAATNMADPNIVFLTAWITTLREVTTVNSYKIKSNSSDYTFVLSGGNITTKSFTYDRKVWTPTASDTVPALTLRNIVKDAKYIADLLSLTVPRITAGGPINRKRKY
jgi:hypothetical protein